MSTDAKDKKQQGFFKSITGAIDDIVSEVKRDLNEMTPPDSAAKKDGQKQAFNNQISSVLQQNTAGVAESDVGGDYAPLEPEAEERPKAAISGLPSGNLWHGLGNPEVSGRLRADAVYHALTSADVKQYSKALKDEKSGPFTLGLVAVNLQALSDEEMAQGGQTVDMLTETLLKALDDEPRLFGAVGAGPRQLWQSVEALDTHLTRLLNDHTKLIALGPLGLDEPFAPYTLSIQQAQLDKQLEIAADFGIPVILSTRKTHAKMAETLEKRAGKGLPVLIYMDPLAGPEDVELVRRFNMHVVLRPELTVPDSPMAAAYSRLNMDRVLLGSGSALVAPHGFSGHFNQPKFLQNTLGAGAKLLRVPERELQVALNGNLKRVFGV